MALAFIENIDFKGDRPNFERDMFQTVEEMKNFSDNFLPELFIATCVETGKLYLYNKNNEVDEVTGKWREMATGNAEIAQKITSSFDVGGVGKEREFAAGTSFESIFKSILEGDTLQIYYGVSDVKEVTGIVGLDSGTASANITASNQYIVFAADTKFGDLIIKDGYGFDNTSDFTKTVQTIGSASFNIYVSKYKITCTDFQYKIYN